jgi:hypothetical protein
MNLQSDKCTQVSTTEMTRSNSLSLHTHVRRVQRNLRSSENLFFCAGENFVSREKDFVSWEKDLVCVQLARFSYAYILLLNNMKSNFKISQ